MGLRASGRLRLIALVVGVVGLAAAGVAYASIPDASGVIHGCYDNKGTLRVIDSATSTCKNNETRLDWNQQGPVGSRGATGPSGPAGATGATGPAGSSGVSGWEIENQAFPLPGGGTPQYGTLSCPSGKKALGGGVTTNTLVNSAIMQDGPLNDGTGWVIEIEQTGGSPDTTAHIWVICASI